ncbi:MAG: hypothetical protein ABS904_00755 [Solibacillus isronensis]
MTAGHFVVRRKYKDNPEIGPSLILEAIVPNSYSTDLELIESLCEKMNRHEREQGIKYTVQSITEFSPHHEVTTDKESGVTGITVDPFKKD